MIKIAIPGSAGRMGGMLIRAIAAASWRDFGAVIVVNDMAEAAALSNRLAPEHLELCVADPDSLAAQITHAGAIFLGAWTPEAIGDYIGGPNHVLPTARSARFSSGLSVMDFIKRTTLTKMTPASLAAIGPAAEVLAISEGLEAHGLSQGRLRTPFDSFFCANPKKEQIIYKVKNLSFLYRS